MAALPQVRNRLEDIPLARGRGGLDPDAVEALIRQLEDEREGVISTGRETFGELNRVQAERDDLQREVQQLRSEVATHREARDAVSQALVVATQEAARIRSQAQEEARQTVASAASEAARVREDARRQGEQMIREATETAATLERQAREGLGTLQAQTQQAGQEARRMAARLREQAEALQTAATELETEADSLPADLTEVGVEFGGHDGDHDEEAAQPGTTGEPAGGDGGYSL